MSRFLIYALCCPRCGAVRYIGKSTSGLYRPRSHKAPSNLVGHDTYKARWIRTLLASGVSYLIRVLEVVERVEDLDAAEVRWIAYGHAAGWPLTNATPGGSSYEFSDEIRAKIKTAKLNQSSETRAKNSASKKGRPLTAEHRAKLKAAAAIRVMSDEGRKALSASRVGRKRVVTDKWRAAAARTAESLRGRRQDPEVVARRTIGTRKAWAAKNSVARMRINLMRVTP